MKYITKARETFNGAVREYCNISEGGLGDYLTRDVRDIAGIVSDTKNIGEVIRRTRYTPLEDAGTISLLVATLPMVDIIWSYGTAQPISGLSIAGATVFTASHIVFSKMVGDIRKRADRFLELCELETQNRLPPGGLILKHGDMSAYMEQMREFSRMEKLIKAQKEQEKNIPPN